MPLPTSYAGQIVRVADLVVARPMIMGVTFENCLIIGPAVLTLTATTAIKFCSFDGPTNANLYLGFDEQENIPMGTVPVPDCSFTDCQFIRISLAGPESFRSQILAGFFG